MASFTEDYLTPEALELIERARAMAPRLAERARAAEDAGLVPSETIDEMQEAGFFKVLQPKRWGRRVCKLARLTCAATRPPPAPCTAQPCNRPRGSTPH